MDCIATKHRKARKEHRCELCGGKINAGEHYVYTFQKDGGDVTSFKNHEQCDFILGELWRFLDPDDGISDDGFQEGCQEYCHEFVCPHCEHCNEGDCELDEPLPYCLDKIAARLKTHSLKKENTGRYGLPQWVEHERQEVAP